MRLKLIALIALLLNPCSTPDPLEGRGNPYAVACTAMSRAGCAEGKDVECADALQHIVTTRVTTVDVPCLTRAKTKEDVRRCTTPRWCE